ncbi:MAG TPA: ABC transporter permease [Acidimicrobiia bacterium]|jgi:ABC-2 type transport system permease protein
MNARTHAIRNGLRRGWAEFILSLKSPQDLWFYLFTAALAVGYLWLNRNNTFADSLLSYAEVTLPSLLGALLVFGLYMGPLSTLAMEKEDGTLLRYKAAPHGMAGYVAGQVVYQTAQILPSIAVILVPSLLLFDGVAPETIGGWLKILWVSALAIPAVLPIGLVMGSLIPGVQKAGTWGMLPMMALFGISGIFFPLTNLWGWVQTLAQVFPMYWLGLGMRSAFLPEAAAALEIGGSWRTLETVLVLAAWAVVGLALAPRVLRRMAERQSGSQVQTAREELLQWVR